MFPLYLIVNEQLRVVWLDNHSDRFWGLGWVHSSGMASEGNKTGREDAGCA